MTLAHSDIPKTFWYWYELSTTLCFKRNYVSKLRKYRQQLSYNRLFENNIETHWNQPSWAGQALAGSRFEVTRFVASWLSYDWADLASVFDYLRGEYNIFEGFQGYAMRCQIKTDRYSLHSSGPLIWHGTDWDLILQTEDSTDLETTILAGIWCLKCYIPTGMCF